MTANHHWRQTVPYMAFQSDMSYVCPSSTARVPAAIFLASRSLILRVLAEPADVIAPGASPTECTVLCHRLEGGIRFCRLALRAVASCFKYQPKAMGRRFTYPFALQIFRQIPEICIIRGKPFDGDWTSLVPSASSGLEYPILRMGVIQWKNKVDSHPAWIRGRGTPLKAPCGAGDGL